MFSQRVKYGIQILAEFEKAKVDCMRLPKSFFHGQCGLDPLVVNEVLRLLHMSQWVTYINVSYFTIRDLRGTTLYDLVMVVDGGISMDSHIREGWSIRSGQSVNARAVIDQITANFINELRGIGLNDLFDCYEVSDRRTLHHLRRIDRDNLLATRDK